MVDTATRLSMLQERFKSGTQKIYIESLRDEVKAELEAQSQNTDL